MKRNPCCKFIEVVIWPAASKRDPGMANVIFKLPDEAHLKFRQLCKQAGTTMSDSLRRFVYQGLSGDCSPCGITLSGQIVSGTFLMMMRIG